MAYYVLINEKFGVERMRIPFTLRGLDDVEDIVIDSATKNITILSRKK